MGLPNLLAFTVIISVIISIFSSSSTSLGLDSSSSSSSSSIYDALQSHGLPIGLLPTGITNFTIDPSTGRFEVRMEQSCDAKFETHVRYDWNVSGTLSYGQIAELSGIAAQDLFLWFPVKGIRVDIPSSGIIYFDVGVVFKQFSLSLFETPRDCTVMDSSSPLTDLTLFTARGGRIVENQSGMLVNKHDRGNILRAVS